MYVYTCVYFYNQQYNADDDNNVGDIVLKQPSKQAREWEQRVWCEFYLLRCYCSCLSKACYVVWCGVVWYGVVWYDVTIQ